MNTAMITQPEIQRLHEAYCQLTGNKLQLTFSRIFAWEKWSLLGLNENDLAITIRYLRNKFRGTPRAVTSLRFEWFIGNPEAFEEDCAEAKAMLRKPRVDKGRQEVLQATGRVDPNTRITARSAADILKAEEAFSAFRQLKETI